MSTENWKLESDLCRCCHAEGSFKNLGVSILYRGVEEIYSNMLRDSLDITLTPVAGPLSEVTYTICKPCIQKLRDAFNFKKQVLACEQRFLDLYSRNIIKVREPELDAVVKEEVPDTYQEGLKEEYTNIDDYDDGFDGKLTDGDDKKELDLEIKLENDMKKNKRKGKSKSKSTAKEKKSCRKVGRPRKIKKEEEGVVGEDREDKQNKGGKPPAAPKFRLMDVDYKRDGDVYQCSRCEKRYDKIFSLRFHVKTKHYKIPRYFCPICSKEFMTLAPLTVHKLEVHAVDDRFKCNACRGIFNTNVQLRKHINNFHMLGEKYKCEFCEYESFSFEGMYKHKFKHKTVKDFHCRFCRKSFLRKTTLDLHERIHTGDRRKVCNICGQAFVQKASLNYHMSKYHPEVNF